MANLSLFEKIQKYAELTNSICPPNNIENTELFEKIINRDNIFNYNALNLKELRYMANEMKEQEINLYLSFYKELATELGIRCIDNEDCINERLIECNFKGEENLSNTVEFSDDYDWGIVEHNNDDTFDKNIFGFDFNNFKHKLEIKKALLLMGVPGTGKSKIMHYMLNELSNYDANKHMMITFEEETSYTDFIGGIVCENGEWVYKDGILTTICKKAHKDRNNKYYLGIDELSRGNTEAILGELMTGIELRDTLITLKNGRKLIVPSNLYFIGAMNITDNSTKKLDIATLERFTHFYIEPQWSNEYIKWLCDKNEASTEVFEIIKQVSSSIVEINKYIRKERILGKDKVIGVRSISNIKLTMENVKHAVDNNLISSIYDRVKNCDYSEIKSCIEDIKGAVK